MAKFKTKISRDKAAALGREAVEIIRQRKYTAPSRRTVSIADGLERAVRGTVSYPPDLTVSESAPGANKTDVEIKNETTLSAATQLLAAGHRPAVLNFASATHPGGGFLAGARAQEEYLARSSGLYACLEKNPMYSFHRARRDSIYTDYVIYSPDVPVFRSDAGVLLEEPYVMSIITSPAVNTKHVQAERRREILPAMWSRILKVLSVVWCMVMTALFLALGAAARLATIRLKSPSCSIGLWEQNFKGAYNKVVFAIIDWSPERKFIGPFQKVFQADST